MSDLLLIHGMGCTGAIWKRLVILFEAAGHVCHTPTLFASHRTHEDPPPTLGDLRLADYTEAMLDKARALQGATGRKPVVLGHSMGGLIAQLLAAQGAVSAGVFLAPAGPKGCGAIDPRPARTFRSVVLRAPFQARARPVRLAPGGLSWGVLNRVAPERHDAIHAATVFESGQVIGDLLRPPAVDVETVKVPTLTIAGRRDRATPARGVRRVAAKYARARPPGDFIEYPESGHWLVDEPVTDSLAADIITWLARKQG